MPGISPPGYLKFIQVLCLLSLVGTLIYGVFTILGHYGALDNSLSRNVVVACILFVLPLSIFYTISTNSPLSRYLIVTYFALTSTTALNINAPLTEWRFALALGVFALFALVTLVWLFVSPRGRVYYAVISHSKIPGDLEYIVDRILLPSKAEQWARRIWEILEPYSPAMIIILAMILVVAGWTNLRAW